MLHLVSSCLAAVAFLAASVNNSTGRAALKADYVRWGFPAWWCYVTALSELVVATCLLSSGLQIFGLILGAAVLIAAVVAVLRRREFKHLPPLAVFTALLVATAVTRAL